MLLLGIPVMTCREKGGKAHEWRKAGAVGVFTPGAAGLAEWLQEGSDNWLETCLRGLNMFGNCSMQACKLYV